MCYRLTSPDVIESEYFKSSSVVVWSAAELTFMASLALIPASSSAPSLNSALAAFIRGALAWQHAELGWSC